MKTLQFVLSLVAVGLAATAALAQEIPKGVRYKGAPDAVNASAKSAIESGLASDSVPVELLSEVFVCGPMLWNALKPSADKVLLDAKPVIALIQVPEAVQTEAKRILKPEERQSFWRLFRNKFPALKTARVRKATSEEISFYWAEIPFDIEEPFFVIETESERFVVNLPIRNGKTTIFWIDLVGDFRTLKH